MLIRVNDFIYVNTDYIVSVVRVPPPPEYPHLRTVKIRQHDGTILDVEGKDAETIWALLTMDRVEVKSDIGWLPMYTHTPIHSPGENVKTILEPMPEPKGKP